jgi:hypothetical protein
MHTCKVSKQELFWLLLYAVVYFSSFLYTPRLRRFDFVRCFYDFYGKRRSPIATTFRDNYSTPHPPPPARFSMRRLTG